MGTFSKTGIPGLRVGYIAASENVHPHLVRLKQSTDLHTNRIGQWWCARFLYSRDYPAHLERLRNFYRERRDAMQAALAGRQPRIQAAGLRAGLRADFADEFADVPIYSPAGREQVSKPVRLVLRSGKR